MSDKESDGPQKSYVTGRQVPNGQAREFDEGDEVLIANGPSGRPIRLTVLEWDWKDGEYKYKLKDRDGNIYSETHEKEEIIWFSEERLELA